MLGSFVLVTVAVFWIEVEHSDWVVFTRTVIFLVIEAFGPIVPTGQEITCPFCVQPGDETSVTPAGRGSVIVTFCAFTEVLVFVSVRVYVKTPSRSTCTA